MEPDAFDPADAEHRQRVVVLQSTELTLDGGAATVEPLPLVARTEDAGLAGAAVAAEGDHRRHVATRRDWRNGELAAHPLVEPVVQPC